MHPTCLQAQHADEAAIELRACDIGICEDARAACASHWDAVSSSAFTGFMHASGVLQDALLGNQTIAGIRAVFAAKVSGAQTLMGALGEWPLGFTTLFSSVAGLLGSAGQATTQPQMLSWIPWLQSPPCRYDCCRR